jgi:plasmid stabilization system protein ParE
MDREIVWTLRATADLESIVEYIFRDSEFYATAVARELMRRRGLSRLSLSVDEWCRSLRILSYER